MSRSTPEWIGRTDDSAPPASVKERIARKADDCCQSCAHKIGGKRRAEFDHVTPLILGGSNRETNLQLLCHECHAAKTKLDVKLKAKVARVRKRNLGIRTAKRKISSQKFQKAPGQHNATRPLTKTTNNFGRTAATYGEA